MPAPTRHRHRDNPPPAVTAATPSPDGAVAPTTAETLDLAAGLGLDTVLSIEHEDLARTPTDGVRRSVDLLRAALSAEPVAAAR